MVHKTSRPLLLCAKDISLLTAYDIQYAIGDERENVDRLRFLCKLFEFLDQDHALLVENIHETLQDGEMEGRSEHLPSMKPFLTPAAERLVMIVIYSLHGDSRWRQGSVVELKLCFRIRNNNNKTKQNWFPPPKKKKKKKTLSIVFFDERTSSFMNLNVMIWCVFIEDIKNNQLS